MSKKLYVGNLAYSVDETILNDIFGRHGEIASVKLITDRDTGRSKGFAFVEMTDSEAADNAIAELNGTEIEGRAVTVNEARPKAPGGGGGGGGRGGFGGGGGGGGGRGGYGGGGGGGGRGGFGGGRNRR